MQKKAVALGNFDGLHIGHKEVIKNALSCKNDGLLPYALLFGEHPLSVIGQTPPRVLMTHDLKIERLRAIGLSVVEFRFGEVMNMAPETFVADILNQRLHAAAVCCGYNYRFGKGAAAGSGDLQRLCSRYGIRTLVSGEVALGGEAVSSTRIRRLIERGEIEKANTMLGRPFSYKLTVIRGDQRGRTMSFPTLNQRFPDGMTVPLRGVYASATRVDGVWKKSVTNIGVRPTVAAAEPGVLSETHIPGFDGSLYGKAVEVELLRYIREERRFGSLDELKAQMRADTLNALR
ncbi:MAG: riboflavin biosynthesis protein RibF [Oscillospiraceae bacterium]|nr:riboflavin biosynthesis protein RibF [Oscillospiraceae bacterium]